MKTLIQTTYDIKIKEGHPEVYAYWYAFAYHSALDNFKSEDYACTYADQLGYEFQENVGRVNFDIVDHSIDLSNIRVLAYMFAWERLVENKAIPEQEDLFRFQNVVEQEYILNKRQGHLYKESFFQEQWKIFTNTNSR